MSMAWRAAVTMVAAAAIGLGAVHGGEAAAGDVSGRVELLANDGTTLLDLRAGDPETKTFRNTWNADRKDFHVGAYRLVEDEWIRIAFSFKPAKDGRVSLCVMSHGRGQWALIDDVSVSGVELPNGGFEQLTNRGDPAGGWWKPEASAATVVPGKGRDGSNAARVDHDNRYFVSFDVKEGTDYTVSFYAKRAVPRPAFAYAVDFATLRQVAEKDKGSFEGPLPEGWKPDYPRWTACEAVSKFVNEGETVYLGIDVRKMDSQRVQFARPIPRPQPGKHYRLDLRYRLRQDNKAELLVRQSGAPYRALWTASLAPSAEWKTEAFVFSVKPDAPSGSVALYLYLNAVGAFDLAALSLSETSGDAVALDDPGIVRPDADRPNFLRNSRLPVGLQSGWNFHRDVTPDWSLSAESGPSGAPYLTFRKTRLLSEPFQVARPGTPHTLSFSYKGSGAVRFGEKEAALAPTTDWRRFALPFVPPEGAKGYAFDLSTDSSLSVDAFRVAPGSVADYVPSAACEVALALPDGPASAARIQFADEPPAVEALVTGEAAEGTILAVRVVNLYGEEDAFTLAVRNGRARIDYARFPATPFGQFRVEVVAHRDGKPASPPNELVVTRLPRPKYWNADAPSSPFGTHVLANSPVLAAVKAGGVNHVRLHDAGTAYIAWSYLEPAPGEWRFRDDAIGAYRARKLGITAVLATAPFWATPIGRELADPDAGDWRARYRRRYVMPDHPEQFGAYAAAVARRYRGVITQYIVWNEPWSPGFLARGYAADGKRLDFPDNAPPFMELQKAAWRAIKAVDPTATVMGYNTVAGVIGERWNPALAALGASDYCDAVDFHLYHDRAAGYPGDVPEQAVAELRRQLPRAEDGAPRPSRIVMSEGQGSSKSGAGEALGEYVGLYRHAIPWKNRDNNLELAELQVRYLASLLATGVERVFLYSSHTYEGLTRPPNFLALLQADGYPHPQLAAVSALALRLEDKPFALRRTLDDQVHVYVFSDGAASTAVVMPRPSAARFAVKSSLPGAVRFDLFGNPYRPASATGRALHYIEAPVPAEELAASLSLD